MGRLLKYLVYLIVLAGLALLAYAYIGPFLGADFSPPQDEMRQPVILNAE